MYARDAIDMRDRDVGRDVAVLVSGINGNRHSDLSTRTESIPFISRDLTSILPVQM